MANINQNYDGQTKLKDWWRIIKSNLGLMNEQTEKHIAGEADRHDAEDIDYAGTISGAETVKEAVEQVQSELDAHQSSSVLDHPNGSVTTAKLEDGAVTDTKIGQRTINKPDSEGTTSGMLTTLLNLITGTIKSNKTDTDAALDEKVDKEEGKGLSTNDYTTEEKTKLAGIEAGANNYIHPTGDGWGHIPATGTSNAGKVLTAGAAPGSVSWQEVPGGGGTGGEGGVNVFFSPEEETPPMQVGDIWYIIRDGSTPMAFANAGYDNFIVSSGQPVTGENWGQIMPEKLANTKAANKTVQFINGKLTVGEAPEADAIFYGDTSSQ